MGCGGSTPTDAGASSVRVVTELKIPKQLLIYYGWPSVINRAGGDVAVAASHFRQYQWVVLGDGLQDASHGDHSKTLEIIKAVPTTRFFGYVHTPTGSLEDVFAKLAAWKLMSVQGVLLDCFGFDFGVSRARQNAIVTHAHSLDLCIIANAWNPDDAFGIADGTPPALSSNDVYLMESFQIKQGTFQDGSEFLEKMQSVRRLQARTPFLVAGVTTDAPSVSAYSATMHEYAWLSACIYELDAFGWGEPEFSAPSASAPPRSAVPTVRGTTFVSPPVAQWPTVHRATDVETLQIDLSRHVAMRLPLSMG